VKETCKELGSFRGRTLRGAEVVVTSRQNLTPDPADAANGDFA